MVGCPRDLVRRCGGVGVSVNPEHYVRPGGGDDGEVPTPSYLDFKPSHNNVSGSGNSDSDDDGYPEELVKNRISQLGGKLVHIVTSLPNLTNYQIENTKILCGDNDKEKCSTNPHCRWVYSACTLISTADNIVRMVNKISDELATNEIKAFEIMRIGMYFVSDIGDYSRFTERPGQTIVKSNSSNITKTLRDIFGSDYIFNKNDKKRTNVLEASHQQLNQENPIIDIKLFYLQKIISNNMTIFRTYANCYYWNKNKYADIQNRNLGYYHPLQNDLSIYFVSTIIDWLLKPTNVNIIPKNVYKHIDIKKSQQESIDTFILKITKDVKNNTTCVFELYVLNQINNIPIIIYDEYQTIIYIFDKELLYDATTTKTLPQQYIKYNQNINYINIRFVFSSDSVNIPEKIEAIYYKEDAK